MKDAKVTDMTKGPVLRQMTAFALPVLFGMLCQRVYNFVDTYIVGNYLGDDALAAVSIAGVAMYMLFSITMGVTTGIGVVLSQLYGAGDEKQLREAFSAGLFVAAAAALILTLGGILTAKPLLLLLKTSPELVPDAKNYLIIIYAGCGATMLYNFSSAALKAIGNSMLPLLFLVVSSVMNIFLDVLLVARLSFGTSGAAFATVAAQLISGVLCFTYAVKKVNFFRFRKRRGKLSLHLVGQILRYGIPTGLQMSIISVSDMTLQAVVNTWGTAMIVAYSVCLKVEGLGFQLTEAIGSALGTFVGQNVGAGNYIRIKKGVKSAYLMNLICCGIFCPAVFYSSRIIMGLFTHTPQAVELGTEYMRFFVCFFFAGGILIVYHNILRASGDVSVTLLMGICEVITRIGCAVLLPALFGYRGLWIVSPLTWVCAAAFGASRYYSGTWEKKARERKEKIR